LSERILMPADGAGPRIAEYAGRACLRGWLGAVAKRTALNLRRNKDDQRHSMFSSTAHALGADVGPEIALLKSRYRREFEAAIRASLASLPAPDRSLLLLQLEGLTLPQLAAMHNVSRATVTRRLASARDALYVGTRRNLTERLRLSPSEFESVAALVRSQLDVSFAAVVRGDGKEE
jgi:RNA polymerase sigma-70 factor (ECF subfamily)